MRSFLSKISSGFKKIGLIRHRKEITQSKCNLAKKPRNMKKSLMNTSFRTIAEEYISSLKLVDSVM